MEDEHRQQYLHHDLNGTQFYIRPRQLCEFLHMYEDGSYMIKLFNRDNDTYTTKRVFAYTRNDMYYIQFDDTAENDIQIRFTQSTRGLPPRTTYEEDDISSSSSSSDAESDDDDAGSEEPLRDDKEKNQIYICSSSEDITDSKCNKVCEQCPITLEDYKPDTNFIRLIVGGVLRCYKLEALYKYINIQQNKPITEPLSRLPFSRYQIKRINRMYALSNV